jgi:DNA modification methylase
MDAADEIVRHGLSQHRDVTRRFAGLSRIRHSKDQPMALPSGDDRLCNRPHLSRFQDLLAQFHDRSISLLNFDPPYVYANVRMYRGRASTTTRSDADTPDAATGLILDLLRDWQPKLALGGVVLLWQPWQCLSQSVLAAIHRYSWSLVGPVVWDKTRGQPGRFGSPYTTHGEMIWVLHRPGDRLTDHCGGSREMILRHPPVSFPGRSRSQLHGFEKPVELCEQFVRKHSRPGDMVFDACGCTGTMTVAAINCGRRWVYAESCRPNYEIGVSRISRALPGTSFHYCG